MNLRYLSLIPGGAVGLAGYLFWNDHHSVSGLGQNTDVLCSSCTYEGLSRNGHLVLMDSSSGEI